MKQVWRGQHGRRRHGQDQGHCALHIWGYFGDDFKKYRLFLALWVVYFVVELRRFTDGWLVVYPSRRD